MIPALLSLALTAAASSGHAPTACDATCENIRRILVDRTNGFENLKGPQVDGDAGNAWTTKHRLLDLECRISNNKPPFPNSFSCFGGFAKGDAFQRRDALLRAFRAAAPDWIWLHFTGSEGTRLRGGPTADTLIAWIDIEHFPYEAGGPVTSIGVGIDIATTAKPPHPVEPYSF